MKKAVSLVSSALPGAIVAKKVIGKKKSPEPLISEKEAMDKGVPFENGKRIDDRDRKMQKYLQENSSSATALSRTLG